MLEKFNEEVDHAPEPKAVDAFGSSKIFEYSKGEILNKLRGIESMSEQETYDLLKKEYPGILSDIFKRSDKDYEFLLHSTRFLSVFNQVLNEVSLSYDQIIYCNSFIYSNIVKISDDNSYEKKLMFNLGETINKNQVVKLLGFDLDERIAIFLVVASKSSFDPQLNVRRLNFSIATVSPSYMDYKMMIHVYETLFDHIGELVTATLFDMDIRNAYDNGEYWVSNDIFMADNRVTDVVLILLESMMPIEITRVLISVAETFRIKYNAVSKECRIRDSIKLIFYISNLKVTDISSHKGGYKMFNIFISQPMKGLSDEEILHEREKAIKKAKEYVTSIEKVPEDRIEIIDSFLKDLNKQEEPPEVRSKAIWMLGHSLELLSKADLIYMCKGWDTASGCRIELMTARLYGIDIIYYNYDGKED